MANQKAIAYFRQGKSLVVQTEYGKVDLAFISSVWGPGDNVDGYRFAKEDMPCLTERQGKYLFGVNWELEKNQADEWAYWELQKESIKDWASRENQE